MPVAADRVQLREIASLPLILPSQSHGLRTLVDNAFARLHITPCIVAEVDGLALLMDMVRAGLGATLQPGAAAARLPSEAYRAAPLASTQARRPNLLASLSEDELSPAALAARVVVLDVARTLVRSGHWAGATLHKS